MQCFYNFLDFMKKNLQNIYRELNTDTVITYTHAKIKLMYRI